MRYLRALWNDEAGLTAVEYALIGTLVAVAITVAAGTLGTAVSTNFTTLSGTISP